MSLPNYEQDLENVTVYPFNPEAIPDVGLKREMSFGNDTNHFIGTIEYKFLLEPERVYDRVATDAKGRVYIGDIQQNKIHVYQSDGTRITGMGRSGHGPGEFQFIGKMKVIGDHLYVIDGNQRINVFSLADLRYLHSICLQPKNKNEINTLDSQYANYFYVRNDNSVLIGFVRPQFLIEDPQLPDTVSFYAMNGQGNINPRPVLKQKRSIFYTGSLGGQTTLHAFSFNPTSLRIVGESDTIFTAWTSDFLIKVYSPEGHYQRAIYYPFPKKSINRTQVFENHIGGRQYTSVLKNVSLPEHWPVIRSIMVDYNSRLWVSTFTGSSDDENQWWILNEHGEMLGKFTLPKTQWLREVRGNHLYVVDNDTTATSVSVLQYSFKL